MRRALFTAILVMAAAQPAAAQLGAVAGDAAPAGLLSASGPEADVQAVADVVSGLFDAMRAGDGEALGSFFHAEARLITTATREGQPLAMIEDVERFVEAVSAPHDQVFDERVRDLEIRVDDNLAVAWMGYDFYLGDRHSHCGVNLFQLVRTTDGWRIIGLADTRRRECR